jgi:hypothetical protein
VTVAVIVHVPLAGIVPPVNVTVRVVGAPDKTTLPPTQVVVGIPVNLRLLFGVVGRVSAKLAPVYGEPVEFVRVIVRLLLVPARKVGN